MVILVNDTSISTPFLMLDDKDLRAKLGKQGAKALLEEFPISAASLLELRKLDTKRHKKVSHSPTKYKQLYIDFKGYDYAKYVKEEAQNKPHVVEKGV